MTRVHHSELRRVLLEESALWTSLWIGLPAIPPAHERSNALWGRDEQRRGPLVMRGPRVAAPGDRLSPRSTRGTT
jgi:hypothetical protein